MLAEEGTMNLFLVYPFIACAIVYVRRERLVKFHVLNKNTRDVIIDVIFGQIRQFELI